MHSHLLPALDDGVKSLAEAKDVVLQMEQLGYRKLVTTPHIMSDAYKNTPEGIGAGLQQLREYLRAEGVGVEIEAAAEYYLDEILMRQLEAGSPLLTFGKKFLLFETNYTAEPFILKEFIFQATAQGYQPVLAHPERYQYMTMEKAEDISGRGVLFQLNLLSLSGFYSLPVRRMAEKFIEKRWIHFLGSDCHSTLQARYLEDVLKTRGLKKAMALPLLNESLMS